MTHQPKWTICFVCDGDGSHVNPNIDAHGLTGEDFADDPDFADEYFSGAYDVGCSTCNGSGKLLAVEVRAHLQELREHAEDRRLRAAEDGDWEGYSVARDYRYG